jgi:hypothetical protein
VNTETLIERPLIVWRSDDRPIFLVMAWLLFATAVAGFAPSSAAILSGRTTVPLVVHVHAACMFSWLLLLVTQASLVATGRLRLHQTLGVASFVVAPAVLAAMITVTIVRYGAMSDAGYGDVASDILLLQIRSIVLFPTFFIWAIATRRTTPDMHKRMMLLATLVLIDAAIARMPWLPWNVTRTSYDIVHGYLLLVLAPALLFDLIRLGRVHRAYVIGLALLLPWMVATSFLWDSPGWLRTAPLLMGRGG